MQRSLLDSAPVRLELPHQRAVDQFCRNSRTSSFAVLQETPQQSVDRLAGSATLRGAVPGRVRSQQETRQRTECWRSQLTENTARRESLGRAQTFLICVAVLGYVPLGAQEISAAVGAGRRFETNFSRDCVAVRGAGWGWGAGGDCV